MIRILAAGDPAIQGLLKRVPEGREAAWVAVQDIIQAVKTKGDEAICQFALQFDRVEMKPSALLIKPEEIDEAYTLVDEAFLQAIRTAAANIKAYHRKQCQNSWFDTQDQGSIVGQLVQPLARVGIYVPGGKASYPSSVLMNAIPAKVAGVEEIVMVTPPTKDGAVNPFTLVAAKEAGVDKIYRVGGAQAVAALAYGTETIEPVDKITGPGNFYVTLAKQQVYGQVDIDMLAGPSEILVIADQTATPSYVAADMLSQAEHDEMAAAILITPDQSLAQQVQEELQQQLAHLPRKEIASKSLQQYGAIILVSHLKEALDLANAYGPEHLELMIAEPFQWLGMVKAAGAVFLGPYSPEPVGDYWAGPNHVLPTGGTARFYSPLGVDAFLKRTSVISYTKSALNQAGPGIIKLAEMEGLDAHARAIKVRIQDV